MIVDGNEGEGERSFADFESQVESGEGGDKTDPNADDPGEGEDGDDEDDPNPNVNDAGDGEDDEDGEDGEGGDDGGKPKKPSAKDMHNLRLKRERDAARDEAREMRERLDAIEKRLTPESDGGKKGNEREAPDPKDLEKYPLGSLDDRYIQDSIDFRADQAAKKMIDAVLQRQQESAEQEAAEALLTDLRSKADNVVTKGSELHDDYESVVYEAGLKGEYDLTQITFEAAAEAENGAQILYDLAVNPEEATRVAQLSPLQQLKYVAEKDAALSKGTAKAKLPGAKPPPSQSPRGGTNRKTISPATPNFAEFERLAEGKS